MTAVTDQDHTDQAGDAGPGNGEGPVEEPAGGDADTGGKDGHTRVESAKGGTARAEAGPGRAREEVGPARGETVEAPEGPADADSAGGWDDGLIARRVTAETEQAAAVEVRGPNAPPAAPLAYD